MATAAKKVAPKPAAKPAAKVVPPAVKATPAGRPLAGKAPEKIAKGWPFPDDNPKTATTTATKTEPKKVESKPQSQRGRIGKFDGPMKIKVLVAENPKRKNSAAAVRFELYKANATVEKYLAAGGTIADVRWDSKQKFISVE